MRKVLWLIVCLMTMVLSVNAQNSIVDEFKTNEPSGEKYDQLLLDPNKSIKENYAKIDSLMSLHKEKNLAKYTIMVEGHYTNQRSDFYDFHVGMIQVKGKNNEQYRTISGQIIETLTELYSHSLGKPFNDEYFTMYVNETTIKSETGRSFKDNKGNITKEYVNRKIGGQPFYCLHSTTQLYKKIYNKVIAETNLQDGGELYELHKRTERMLSH